MVNIDHFNSINFSGETTLKQCNLNNSQILNNYMQVFNLHVLKGKAFRDWLDNIFISLTLTGAFPTAFTPIKAPIFMPLLMLLSQTKILSPTVCQFKLRTS